MNTIQCYCYGVCEAIYVNGKLVYYGKCIERQAFAKLLGFDTYASEPFPAQLNKDIESAGTANYKPPATLVDLQRLALERQLADLDSQMKECQTELSALPKK